MCMRFASKVIAVMSVLSMTQAGKGKKSSKKRLIPSASPTQNPTQTPTATGECNYAYFNDTDGTDFVAFALNQCGSQDCDQTSQRHYCDGHEGYVDDWHTNGQCKGNANESTPLSEFDRSEMDSAICNASQDCGAVHIAAFFCDDGEARIIPWAEHICQTFNGHSYKYECVEGGAIEKIWKNSPDCSEGDPTEKFAVPGEYFYKCDNESGWPFAMQFMGCNGDDLYDTSDSSNYIFVSQSLSHSEAQVYCETEYGTSLANLLSCWQLPKSYLYGSMMEQRPFVCYAPPAPEEPAAEEELCPCPESAEEKYMSKSRNGRYL